MFASLVVVIVLVALFSNALGELTINTDFKPEGCESARRTVLGDKIFVHYTGSIDESSSSGQKGKVFDSSRTRNKPFSFVLGKGEVIRGWDEGLVDMCPGEKRTLIIPPDMGYGDRGAGGAIPGGATLKFDVECVSISSDAPEPPRNVFAEMDKDNDGIIIIEEFQQWFIDVGHPSPGDALKYFQQEDRNEDGAISWEEFSGPKGSKSPKTEL